MLACKPKICTSGDYSASGLEFFFGRRAAVLLFRSFPSRLIDFRSWLDRCSVTVRRWRSSSTTRFSVGPVIDCE